MIIADTDVLIDFLKNKGAAKEVAALLKTGQLATTTLSVFELWVGAKTPDQIAHIETLLNALQIYQLNLAAAKMAGACHKNLQASKNEIGMADALIAGICIENKVPLFTRNKKHFSRISELKLYD